MSLPFVASLAATSASKESKAAKADVSASSGASFGEALKAAISESSAVKEQEAHAREKEPHMQSEVAHSSASSVLAKSEGMERKKGSSKENGDSENVSASSAWLSALAYVSSSGTNTAPTNGVEAASELKDDVTDGAAGQSIGIGAGRKKLSALSLLQSQHNSVTALADESDSMMGGASIGDASGETLFNQLLPGALSSKMASLRNGSRAADVPASTVTLSSEWTSSMISGVATMQDSQGALAETVKTVRSVLQEYWVPPVNISTQSPTQATVQLNLQNGDTMRLQIDLGQAAHMGLRVEAPAALLADMQARLAPLQEALMQQGLTLLPVEWVAAKPSATRVNAIGQAGGMRSEQTKIEGKRKEDGFFSDTSNESVLQQVVSMEDVLE